MKRVCVMGREKKNEREKKRERNIILMENLIELFLFFFVLSSYYSAQL